MGGSVSTVEDLPSIGGTEGFHVLRVQEGSPGAKAGLQAYFDYIVSVEGTRLNRDDETLKQALTAYEDRPVKISVYSSKNRSLRNITFTPNSVWGGQGLLGISLRFCSFNGAHERVWHVLDAQPGSPAALAGLQSDTDFIVGAERVLHEESDFYNLVESCDGRVMKLYVYSSITDSCREVQLSPNSNWGGDGLLGCRIGFGYLHRIPDPATNPISTSAASTSAAASVVARTPNVNADAKRQSAVDSRGFVDVPLDSPRVMSPNLPALPPASHISHASATAPTMSQNDTSLLAGSGMPGLGYPQAVQDAGEGSFVSVFESSSGHLTELTSTPAVPNRHAQAAGATGTAAAQSLASHEQLSHLQQLYAQQQQQMVTRHQLEQHESQQDQQQQHQQQQHVQVTDSSHAQQQQQQQQQQHHMTQAAVQAQVPTNITAVHQSARAAAGQMVPAPAAATSTTTATVQSPLINI